MNIENPNVPRLALRRSIILFAGYPFALAGHYDLYTKGPRSYAYATQHEKMVVLITIVVAIMFLGLSIWANWGTVSNGG